MQKPSSTIARPTVILGTKQKKPNPNAMLYVLEMQIYAASATPRLASWQLGTIRSVIRGGIDLSIRHRHTTSRRPQLFLLSSSPRRRSRSTKSLIVFVSSRLSPFSQIPSRAGQGARKIVFAARKCVINRVARYHPEDGSGGSKCAADKVCRFPGAAQRTGCKTRHQRAPRTR